MKDIIYHSDQLIVSWFLKVDPKSGQTPCTIVQGTLSKIARKEFSILIIFSDTYTCTYVV